MALICVIGRREPIEISNERARVLKTNWLNDQTPKDKKLDLQVWAGTYGQIKSIEMTAERIYHEHDEKPQTEEQRRRTTEGMQRIGHWVKKQPWYKDPAAPSQPNQ